MPTDRFTGLVLGANLAGTDNADGTLTIDASAAAGGSELGYAQITAAATVSSTTEATPSLIVALGAITYAASATVIEFYAPSAFTLNGRYLIFNLWDGVPGAGGTNLGYIAGLDARGVTGSALNFGFPIFASRELTPTAASHTYAIYGWVIVGTATSTGVSAGAGGASTFLPAFIRARLA